MYFFTPRFFLSITKPGMGSLWSAEKADKANHNNDFPLTRCFFSNAESLYVKGSSAIFSHLNHSSTLSLPGTQPFYRFSAPFPRSS